MRIYFIFISYMLCNLSYLSNAFVNINIYGTGLYLPYSMGVIGYIKNNIPIKNYNITVDFTLSEDKESQIKFLTGKDRFTSLAKKNPNLHSFKTVFNLDIEF